MRTLVLACLLIVLCAAAAHGQFIDAWWESQQRRHTWLQQLDNTDAKTWAAHSLLTLAGGTLIGALTPLSITTGIRGMVGFYFVREILNRTTWRPLRFDYRYKPLDGVMDFTAPLIVGEIVVRL